MTSKNEHTGDLMKSRVNNKNYDEGWERIFGKRKNMGGTLDNRYDSVKEEPKPKK